MPIFAIHWMEGARDMSPTTHGLESCIEAAPSLGWKSRCSAKRFVRLCPHQPRSALDAGLTGPSGDMPLLLAVVVVVEDGATAADDESSAPDESCLSWTNKPAMLPGPPFKYLYVHQHA